MKWSQFFIPTTKESPSDAVVPSHQLMIRAGLIRQVVAGAYTYLPLGYRTLRKIEQIVREEMNRAGAIELNMPAMHPIEWWQQTGRVAAMGDVLLRLGGGGKDDWRSRTVLGPTHEEVITETARAYLNSYKQLPINLYQIQTKFRGEARPKSGVLRTREFLMKDAYSFHLTKEGPGGLDETYQKMYDAYCRIFGRCGLPYIAVEADSGPIGGDASHEFMVATEAGEDYLVQSEDGSYAANLERAEIAPVVEPDNQSRDPNQSRDREGAVLLAPGNLESHERRSDQEPLPHGRGSDQKTQARSGIPLKEVHTPNLKTIDEVSAFLKCKPEQMIKTIIFEADGRPLIALVRGDHEVNEGKLRRAAGVKTLTQAEPDLIRRVTGAEVGFAGPVRLPPLPKEDTKGSQSPPLPRGDSGGASSAGQRSSLSDSTGQRESLPYPIIIADQAVTVMHNAVTGANKTDYHLTGVNPGRDFVITESADIRVAVPGDRAKNGSPLIFKKCIEVGHVFKLGTKYSLAMDAKCLDANGKPRPFIMGCYGIGLNRIMAAAIESSHDEKGIIWPMSIAPFHVVICALDTREQAVVETAERLERELEAAGVEVLLDDREARPGFKFADAELIGFPIRITVGKKGVSDGVVEIQYRKGGDIRKMPPGNVVEIVRTAFN